MYILLPRANSLFLWWRHLASYIYIHIYTCVSRCVHELFSFFLPFAVHQSWYLMLDPVATRYIFLHINIRTCMCIYGSHPKRFHSCIQEHTSYIYISSIWASSPHFLRWHHLEIHPSVFTDYLIICSRAIIPLVRIPGPTAIEDGFDRNSMSRSL